MEAETEGIRAFARPEASLASGASAHLATVRIGDTNRATAASRALDSVRREYATSAPRRVGGALGANHELRLRTHILDTTSNSVYGVVAGARRPAAGIPAITDQRASLRKGFPYIVQFDGPIVEDWTASVRAAGGVMRGYLPQNAFLLEMSADTADAVSRLPAVQWVGEYRPEYKVQPFLARWADGTLAAAFPGVAMPSGVGVSVQTFAPEDAGEVAQEIRRLGGTVTAVSAGERSGLVRAKLAPRAIPDLAAMAIVQWIEEYMPPVPQNDFAVKGNHLNVTNVWNVYGLDGSNQIVGHADTGLDMGATNGIHPDFAGRVKVAYALGRAGDWSDPDGHGTHTAGSILGSGAASAGQYRGVAPAARIVHQSVLDSFGGLGGIPADLNNLFNQTYTNGARIHSDSWGAAYAGQYTLDSQQADEFTWNHPDMLLVFAAGNEGVDKDRNGVVDFDSIDAPGTAKNVLTVGAAENDRASGSGGYSSYQWGTAWSRDYRGEPIKSDYISQSADGVHQGMAAFSSRGPTDDGRTKPDIVAPGTDVISCRSREPGAGTGWGMAANTNYVFSGGTSMATPMLAGCAALVRQYYAVWQGITNPSAALVKGTLLNGARSLTPGQYGTGTKREIPAAPRPNNVEGWGEADMQGTLFPAAPRKLLACATNALSTGATNVYTLYIGSSNRLSVTLAYSDYPATAGAGLRLVNDLDLSVTNPGGTNFYASGRTSPDRTNNVEGIDVGAPSPGLYTIRVKGFNVPNGPQPYALVVSGDWSPIVHTPLSDTANASDPYPVDAVITSLNPPGTNAPQVLWNTTGSTQTFASAAMAPLTGSVYRAFLPAQPYGSIVYYYLRAALEGRVWASPTNATAVLHHFHVGAIPLPLVALLSAAQTSTNGTGHVTVSNTVFDADGATCEMEVLFATNAAAWANAWMYSATGALGRVAVSNTAPPQVRGIATTNAAGLPVTNTITVVWSTTNASPAIVFSTNVLMRLRVWNGVMWSDAVTSAPFRVDNEPPAGPGDLASLTHTAGVWSASRIVSTRWAAADDGRGGGVAGYGVVFTNGLPAQAPRTIGTFETNAVSGSLADGSNWWFAVRAVDWYGNWGASTGLGPFRVDATAPFTVSDADSVWHTNNFNVRLTAADVWSGVARTEYQVDDGPVLSGTNVAIAVEGTNHTIAFWSLDVAGNREPTETVSGIRLDKSGPVFTGWSRTPANLTIASVGPLRVALHVADAASGIGTNVPALAYRTNDGSYGAYVPMAQTDSVWWADIHGDWLALRGSTVSYKVRARDAAGNEVESAGQSELVDNVTYLLNVRSDWGQVAPTAGVHVLDYGAAQVCEVLNSTVAGGSGTQYLCVGWTMSGHSPDAGGGTNFTMIATNDATLTWQWGTNYSLTLTAVGPGTVDPAGGWYLRDSNVVVTATPYDYCRWTGWTGDTNGFAAATNRVTVPVDGPRSISAEFAPNLATNGTPQWWLAAFGLTNRDWDVEATNDQDDDGMFTWQEWWADTIPTSFSSRLVIKGILPTNGGYRVYWVGGTGAWQRLHFCPDTLSTESIWSVVFTNLPPTTITNWMDHSGAGNAAGFYRIEAGR
jgi:hypothetical protein